MWILTALASTVLIAAAPAAGPDEASLRAADVEQTRIIVNGHTKAQELFMHPNYVGNAPANRVLAKAQVLAMLGKGQIASESFKRTIERSSITGPVGIVMGDEIIVPSATGDLGRMHPGQTLHRRFTNVFSWAAGQWRFLAWQASIVPEERTR